MKLTRCEICSGTGFSLDDWTQSTTCPICQGTGNLERVDPLDDAVRSLDGMLYGPKFCPNCKRFQPVITYKVKGSDTMDFDGTTVRVGFTGAYACSVCYHTIDAAKSQRERAEGAADEAFERREQ